MHFSHSASVHSEAGSFEFRTLHSVVEFMQVIVCFSNPRAPAFIGRAVKKDIFKL